MSKKVKQQKLSNSEKWHLRPGAWEWVITASVGVFPSSGGEIHTQDLDISLGDIGEMLFDDKGKELFKNEYAWFDSLKEKDIVGCIEDEIEGQGENKWQTDIKEIKPTKNWIKSISVGELMEILPKTSKKTLRMK